MLSIYDRRMVAGASPKRQTRDAAVEARRPVAVACGTMARMPRLDRIYTKTGDEGMTGLGGGQRVPKDSRARRRPTARSTSSTRTSGWRSRPDCASGWPPSCRRSRTSCSTSGRTCAGRPTTRAATRIPTVEARHVEALERAHRRVQRGRRAARRTSCCPAARRARPSSTSRGPSADAPSARPSRLARDEPIGEHVLPYLNRLSDALFVMARYENHERGVAEPLWQPGR